MALNNYLIKFKDILLLILLETPYRTSDYLKIFIIGIQHAVGGLASKPERDLLMQDFMTVETTNFPSEGSNHTPAHHYSEFKYKNYAPIAFRYFRDLFGIQPDDFLVSILALRVLKINYNIQVVDVYV